MCLGTIAKIPTRLSVLFEFWRDAVLVCAYESIPSAIFGELREPSLSHLVHPTALPNVARQ